MKLFDYKLILLIALTFVVYFMYRELTSLNSRLDSLEKNVNNLPKQIEQKPEPKFINFNAPETNVDVQLNNNIPDETTLQTTTNKLNDVLPNESCTISTEEEDSDNLEAINKTNAEDIEEDAVEIYSNDNVEGVSSNNTSEVNMDDMIIRNTNGVKIELTSQEVVNSEESNNSSSESNNMIDLNEDGLNLSASSMSSIDDDDINDIMTGNQSVEAPKSPIVEKKATVENTNIISEESSHNNSNEKSEDNLSLDDLMKNNKLNQLKEMAKQLNIELKKNDGKAKTKKQLAEEIVSLKNSQ